MAVSRVPAVMPVLIATMAATVMTAQQTLEKTHIDDSSVREQRVKTLK